MDVLSNDELHCVAADIIGGITTTVLNKNSQKTNHLQKIKAQTSSISNSLQTSNLRNRCFSADKQQLLSIFSEKSRTENMSASPPIIQTHQQSPLTSPISSSPTKYNNWLDMDKGYQSEQQSVIMKSFKYGKQCPQCLEINDKDSNWCLECGKAVLSVEIRKFELSFSNEPIQQSSAASQSAPTNIRVADQNMKFPFLQRQVKPETQTEKGIEDKAAMASSNQVFHYRNKTSVTKDLKNKCREEKVPSDSILFDFNNPQLEEETLSSQAPAQSEDSIYRKFPSETKYFNFYAFDDVLYPNYAIYNPSLGYVFPSSNVVSNGSFYNQQLHFEMPLTKINNQNRKEDYKKSKKMKKKKCKSDGVVSVASSGEVPHINLPDEILLKIFSYISLADLAKCCRVCKQFNRIANDECLWKEIIIKRNNNLTDIVLSKIARKTPRVLKITQCNGKRLTEDGLRHLFRACSESLEFLDISGCSGSVLNGESVLLHVSSRCKNIRSLDISWSTISNIGVQSICESTNSLVQFSLNGCQRITDDSVAAIAEKHGQSLKILELFGCFNLTASSINKVASLCHNIVKLNLGQCHKMTNEVLISIANSLSELQSLDIRGCKQIRDSSLKQVITGCPKLTSLVIANCPGVSDSTLYAVSSHLPDLRTLDACGCCKVSDRGIHALAKKCKQLSVLDLSSTKVTNKSVMTIAYNCNEALMSLKLSFCHSITDTCLLTVAQRCKKLRTLHLYGCKPLRNLWRLTEINPLLKVEKESGR